MNDTISVLSQPTPVQHKVIFLAKCTTLFRLQIAIPNNTWLKCVLEERLHSLWKRLGSSQSPEAGDEDS